MKPHLELAKKLWKEVLSPTDWVIDATCGNGHDTLFLAGLANVMGLDIQEKALENTKKLLDENGRSADLRLLSHEFVDTVEVKPKLIVYNLGYLPGADKSLTTRVESTLKSVEKALRVADYVSIMCYPGHEEGAREEEALLSLNLEMTHYTWDIRPRHPSLIWMSSQMPITSAPKS